MNTLEQQLQKLDGWERHQEQISKTFGFDAYLTGILFVERLAAFAEAVQHHPQITIDHTNVTIVWTTVDEGKLTDKDIDGAHAADNLYQANGQ
ncbi:4a-hydroxytetrahydrobiopterin dehydratase [Geomicrobium sediminis]|uniref:4a-hydroxytetrahydrobiopterin dehydratase n=1 Tax=Geomicrobium sediminis TaxID=1347788 RepID=A0ABS2P931_9BACL|nr:4a-hydroxytetrahydrobiopterin dehydratase [Geomicrobium sediminis]MBM7631585.1 4a-hydroxytetrahydrobiopterin dehydratase [Geomicrobium sediminis]